jgi:4-diphosphocytidyl-2-C-methyl-D-erythritol kinase
MQSLDLHDTVIITKSPTPRIQVKTNLHFLPTDQGNLVYRAARLFLETFSLTEGVDIVLEKRIPVAAGLAGGSSDAAATLKGLNELFQTRQTKEELQKLGVKLGADIPYCIQLGTALSEGIGEVLTPVKPMPNCSILLVKPNFSVSTKYVYENLQLNNGVIHPDIHKMLYALDEQDLSLLTTSMDNILETVTAKEYPLIEKIKQKMKGQGALTALMSGSGPTIFGIYDKEETARNAYTFFKNRDKNYEIYLTKPYWPEG